MWFLTGKKSVLGFVDRNAFDRYIAGDPPLQPDERRTILALRTHRDHGAFLTIYPGAIFEESLHITSQAVKTLREKGWQVLVRQHAYPREENQRYAKVVSMISHLNLELHCKITSAQLDQLCQDLGIELTRKYKDASHAVPLGRISRFANDVEEVFDLVQQCALKQGIVIPEHTAGRRR